MFCDKCGKNIATTHIKTVVNGVLTEHDLCTSCAAEAGYGDLPNGGLADLLISMLNGISPNKLAENTRRCPVCGATFADIAKTGKAGCAECYKTFYSDLLPYLKRLHGSVKHIGKIPNSAPLATVPDKNKIETLRMELNRLVGEERYEEAAIVRDQIKELEEKKDE